ncbi:hypothetical protein BDW66DRAFT_114328 [Aspergillus desertorum]
MRLSMPAIMRSVNRGCHRATVSLLLCLNPPAAGRAVAEHGWKPCYAKPALSVGDMRRLIALFWEKGSVSFQAGRSRQCFRYQS